MAVLSDISQLIPQKSSGRDISYLSIIDTTRSQWSWRPHPQEVGGRGGCSAGSHTVAMKAAATGSRTVAWKLQPQEAIHWRGSCNHRKPCSGRRSCSHNYVGNFKTLIMKFMVPISSMAIIFSTAKFWIPTTFWISNQPCTYKGKCICSIDRRLIMTY